jgi:hypothetical protein
VSAILIISVILAFVASFAILRTKRSRSNEDADALPPYGAARGLFADDAAPGRFGATDAARADEKVASENLSKALRERASRGDFEALTEARASKDSGLYGSVLGALVEACAADASRLRALGQFVAKGEGLRSSAALASALTEEWEREPSHAFAPTLMRVAALSDDADAFGRASDAVLGAWLGGRLAGSDADGLRSLFEAEYWLLSSEARRSGAGFRLKQQLAQVRRTLSEQARRRQMPLGSPAPAGDAGQKERQ